MQVNIRLIIGVLIFYLLYIFIFNIVMVFMPEKLIAKYILRNTPIGSSKEDVREFIKRKDFAISNRIQDMPHILRGETFPIDYPRDIYRRYSLSSRVGHSNIDALIANIFDYFLYADCTWVFDEEGKLILIDIRKGMTLL